MKFDETTSLPLPPAETARMISDPEYTAIRGRVLGASSATSQVTGDPDGEMTIVTELSMPTDRVPDIAKRFVGKTVTIKETQTWAAPADSGERTGRIRIEVPGIPVSVEGTSRLTPQDDHSQMEVSGDLTAKIPLVGGKLEKAAAPYIGRVFKAEERAAREYAKR